MTTASPTTVTLEVRGMHCAGCATRLENSLKKAVGVRDAKVNLGAEQAVVQFDSMQTSPEKLAAAVELAGFEVQLPPNAA